MDDSQLAFRAYWRERGDYLILFTRN